MSPGDTLFHIRLRTIVFRCFVHSTLSNSGIWGSTLEISKAGNRQGQVQCLRSLHGTIRTAWFTQCPSVLSWRLTWTLLCPNHAFSSMNSKTKLPPIPVKSSQVFPGVPQLYTTPLYSQLTWLCGTSFHLLSSAGTLATVWCAAEAKINFTHIQKFGITSINNLNHTGWKHQPWNWYSKKKLEGLLQRGIYARLSRG